MGIPRCLFLFSVAFEEFRYLNLNAEQLRRAVIASYDKALKIRPAYPQAWFKRGYQEDWGYLQWEIGNTHYFRGDVDSSKLRISALIETELY